MISKIATRLYLFALIAPLSFNSYLSALPYLFEQYPHLQHHIPHVTLCDLPTPIIHLQTLGNQIGCKALFMKHDGLSGKKQDDGTHLYGGNKPRKLEFLFGDALVHNARKVATFGCVGSNHALAVATYAHEQNLPCTLLLLDQPNSAVVQQNLLLDHHYGATLQFFPDVTARNNGKDALLAQNPDTYFIPTGGSNARGTLGFVNAAFELAHQINAGEITEPNYIYVAAGSCGTVAGLLLGLRLANVSSEVIAVTVFPERVPGTFLTTIQNLFTETASLLHSLDDTVPLVPFSEARLTINTELCGTRYGLYTEADRGAIELIKSSENSAVEGTYTAKPVAALVYDALYLGSLKNKTVLFWNTYCGLNFSSLTEQKNYKQLPDAFHKYFEQETQTH